MKQRVRRVGDRRGANNPNWKGGVRKLGNYYWVFGKHPRAVKFGQTPYTLRSVINLEKKLGRSVPKNMLAHHKKGNKLDDRPSQLHEISQKEHRRHHAIGKSNEVRRLIKKETDRLAQDSQHENLT